MKKDIERPEVKDVAVAVISEMNDAGAQEWNVYLINLKNEPLKGILVTSKGYGMLNDEKRETSVLRQFFEELPARDFLKIEPIMEEVFGLTNEYWVSFYIDKVIFDKKFIFLPETISPLNFTQVPLIKHEGILIR